MKRYYTSLLVLIISGTYLLAQTRSDDGSREHYLDGEFFFYQEEYADAVIYYQRLYNQGFADNPDINYKIGVCYLNMAGQKKLAIPYLEKASLKVSAYYKEGFFRQEYAPVDVYLFLGNAYRIDNRLDDAIKTYQKFLTIVSHKKPLEIKYAKQQIVSCENAKIMQKNPVGVQFTNIGSPVNTSVSNYAPVVSGDGNTLLYMNQLPFYHAVYYTVKSNGVWATPRNITPEIQSDGDLYCTGLSYDGKAMLLSKVDPFGSNIWASNLKDNGTWSVATPIREINSKFFDTDASYSPDGKRLFFASNRNGTIGEMDIFMSEIDAMGLWKVPVNLGETINTGLNEENPVMTADGKKLFFCSQGHQNIGGYDVFYSELIDGTWGNPVNLGYPANTTDDDMYFYPLGDGSSGYLSRYTLDGYGRDDIYLVTISALSPEEKVIITETLADIDEQLIGETYDTLVADIIVDEEAIIQEPDKPEPVKEIEAELFEISLLYYEFNSVALTAEARKQLDGVVALMKKYGDIKIELNGYTDSKGPEEINRVISLRRAESAREYLVRNGITYGRIKINGYGKTGFIAINTQPDGSDSPQGRRYNRRVEIKVPSAGNQIKIIYKTDVPEGLRFIE